MVYHSQGLLAEGPQESMLRTVVTRHLLIHGVTFSPPKPAGFNELCNCLRLFPFLPWLLGNRLAAYSNKGFNKYFWNNLTPSGFYTPFLAQFLLCSFELQA